MSDSGRIPLPRFEVANRICTLVAFAIVVGVILAGADLVVVIGVLALLIVLTVLICSPSRSWWRDDHGAVDAFQADRPRVKREMVRDLALDVAIFVAIGFIYAIRNPMA